MGEKLTAELINREALVILNCALSGEPMPEWREPLGRFSELETSGPDDQEFIGLYVPTDILDLCLPEVSRQIAPAVIELARRIEAGGIAPSVRELELPKGVETARDQHRGVAIRTVIMDYPARSSDMAKDFGGRVIGYYNTDVDAIEQRCCVKAIRFDVPLLRKETETDV